LPAAPDMVDLLLKYPAGNQNAVVVRALERVSVGAADTLVPGLTEALRPGPAEKRTKDEFDRRTSVVDFLGRLGPQAKAAALQLRAIMAQPPSSKNPQDPLRAAVAEALWHVEGGANDALAVLVAMVAAKAEKDPARNAGRSRAVQALGRIGAPAKSAVPALTDQFKNGRTPFDRLDAAEALWRVTGDAKPLMPFLIEVLKEKPKESGQHGFQMPTRDTSVQARAIAVLSQMGAAARDTAPALAAAIRAEDEFNARQSMRVRRLKNDEEDEDPDTSELLRRTGLPVLQQLDPTAAKALVAPSKKS
jgi:hypothetical protein